MEQIEYAKKNMLEIINQQDKYNTYLSTIFIILIALYSFIFLIYIPMINNDEPEVKIEISTNEPQTMVLEVVTKTNEPSS